MSADCIRLQSVTEPTGPFTIVNSKFAGPSPIFPFNPSEGNDGFDPEPSADSGLRCWMQFAAWLHASGARLEPPAPLVLSVTKSHYGQ
jgi:hypothetical protein